MIKYKNCQHLVRLSFTSIPERFFRVTGNDVIPPAKSNIVVLRKSSVKRNVHGEEFERGLSRTDYNSARLLFCFE